MSRRIQPLILALVVIGLAVTRPANAQTVYDGVTSNQLANIFGAMGYSVSSTVTQKGNPYLMLQDAGKQLQFAAFAIGCNNGVRCEGIEIFTVDTGFKPPLSFVNQFNSNATYAYAKLNAQGSPVILSQHVALGGISENNIRWVITAFIKSVGNFNTAKAGGIALSGAIPDTAFSTADAAQDYAASVLKPTGGKPSVPPTEEDLAAFVDARAGH